MKILSMGLRLWQRGIRAIRRDLGKECDARYYDRRYKRGGDRQEYFKPAEECVYFPVWQALIARLQKDRDRILELGCGPGQLAVLLLRGGYQYLRGIDFSREAIALAQRTAGESLRDKFVLGDLYDATPYREVDYNTIICCEVLEHLENDLGVLDMIRPSVKILGTLPNYPSRAHLRHFADEARIRDRYVSRLDIRTVEKIVLNPRGNAIFLMEGRKKP